MKKLFIKWATLLLSGAMLLNVGCADYDEDIRNLQGQIDQLTSVSIANLGEQVENINDAVEALETTIAELEEVNEANEALLAEIEAELAKKADNAALEAAKAFLETKINDNLQVIEGLQTQITSLETRLAALEALHDKEFNELRDLIAANAEAIVAAKLELTEAYKAADKELHEEIDALEALINEFGKKVEDAVKKVEGYEETFNKFNQYMTDTDKTLADYLSRIEALEDADLDARVKVIEGILGEDIAEALKDAGLGEGETLSALVKDYAALKNSYTQFEAMVKKNYATKEELGNAQEALQQAIDDVAKELGDRLTAAEEEITKIKRELMGRLGAFTPEFYDAVASGLMDVNGDGVATLDERFQLSEDAISNLQSLVGQMDATLTALYEQVQELEAKMGIFEQLQKDLEAALAGIQSISHIAEYTDGTYDLITLGVDTHNELVNYVDLVFHVTANTPAEEDGILSVLENAWKAQQAGEGDQVLSVAAAPAKVRTRANNPLSTAIIKVWVESDKLYVRTSILGRETTEGANVALLVNMGVNNIVSDYAGVQYDALDMKQIYLHEKNMNNIEMPWNKTVEASHVEYFKTLNFVLSLGDGVEYSFEDFEKEFGVTLATPQYTATETINNGKSVDDVFTVEGTTSTGKNVAAEAYSVEFVEGLTRDNVGDILTTTFKFDVEINGHEGSGLASTGRVDYTYTITNTYGGTFYFNATGSPEPGTNVKDYANARGLIPAAEQNTHFIEFPWNYGWLRNHTEFPSTTPSVLPADLIGYKTGEIKLEFVPSEFVDQTPVSREVFEAILGVEPVKYCNGVKDPECPVNFKAVASNAAYAVYPSLDDTYEWGEVYEVDYVYTYNEVDYHVIGTVKVMPNPVADMTLTMENEETITWKNTPTETSFDLADLLGVNGFDDAKSLGFEDNLEFVRALLYAADNQANSLNRFTTYYNVWNYATTMAGTYQELTHNANANVTGSISVDNIFDWADTFEQQWILHTWFGLNVELTAEYVVEKPTLTLVEDGLYVIGNKAYANGYLNTATGHWAVETMDETANYYTLSNPELYNANLFYTRYSTDDARLGIIYPEMTTTASVNTVGENTYALPTVAWVFDVTTQRTVQVDAHAGVNNGNVISDVAEFCLDEERLTIETADPIKTFAAKNENPTANYAENEDGSLSVRVNLIENITIEDAQLIDGKNRPWVKKFSWGWDAMDPTASYNFEDAFALKAYGTTDYGWVFDGTNTHGISYRIADKGGLKDLYIDEYGVLTYVVEAGGTVPQRDVNVKIEAGIKYWLGEKKATFTVTLVKPAIQVENN